MDTKENSMEGYIAITLGVGMGREIRTVELALRHVKEAGIPKIVIAEIIPEQ
ncbi:hypothetical protein ACFSTA_07295 [Ornithinibacillus salinisoli]|uniref:Uncharacterized protein n=2 Tax=Ornithinibacillus salinisoli TaxID=1848459 RepID=A0ABW4VW20_9BACI